MQVFQFVAGELTLGIDTDSFSEGRRVVLGRKKVVGVLNGNPPLFGPDGKILCAFPIKDKESGNPMLAYPNKASKHTGYLVRVFTGMRAYPDAHGRVWFVKNEKRSRILLSAKDTRSMQRKDGSPAETSHTDSLVLLWEGDLLGIVLQNKGNPKYVIVAQEDRLDCLLYDEWVKQAEQEGVEFTSFEDWERHRIEQSVAGLKKTLKVVK